MAPLSQSAQNELFRAYKKTKDHREKTRLHALWLLSQGRKQIDIAALLGISRDSVRHWKKAYDKHGIAGIESKPQPGNNRSLTSIQKDAIKEVLKNKTPEDMKYRGRFWTVPLLKKLVRDMHGISYKSTNSYRRLFEYCGFSFHKPEKVDRKQREHDRVRYEEIVKKNSDGTVEKITWSW
jgi:transposase